MNAMPPGSIRARLMRLQWLALLITGTISGLVSFALTWHTVNELRDHTLEQVAQSVVRHGLEVEDDGTHPDPDLPDQGQFTSQVWAQDGSLQYTSSASDDGPPRQPPGWHRVQWQNQSWHVFTLVQDEVTVQVSQPDQPRSQAFWQMAPALLLALVALTAGLYGLLHLAATASLQPLNELRQQLAEADPLHPQTPWADQPWPDELQPLVRTLGDLFERLADARQAQQHLVARAAHEFRTPLAALKIHTQLLGRSHTDQPSSANDERHREHLLQAIDRMTRLVDQLLRLAELDAMTGLPAPELFEVQPWLANALPLWEALAKGHGVTLATHIPGDARLYGQPTALLAMLENVVHNALRHSPVGTTTTVSLMKQPTEWTWKVIDHGTGMTPQQRSVVGQSFISMGSTHTEGSGLGLAIACRVAALHHGHLNLQDTPGGGLTVVITLPASLSA